MEPNEITMRLVQAKEAFAAILPHVSSDDVTPVITCAYIDGDQILATDRYTMARHGLGAKATGPILLPRAAVAFIARFNLRGLLFPGAQPSYTVTIQAMPPVSDEYQAGKPIQPTRVSISGDVWGEERVMLFEHYRGNFPPTGRLLDEFKPSGEAYSVGLAPEHLDKVLKFAHQYHRGRAVDFELGTPTSSGKPSPVRARIGGLAALIQPNLKLAG